MAQAAPADSTPISQSFDSTTDRSNLDDGPASTAWADSLGPRAWTARDQVPLSEAPSFPDGPSQVPAAHELASVTQPRHDIARPGDPAWSGVGRPILQTLTVQRTPIHQSRSELTLAPVGPGVVSAVQRAMALQEESAAASNAGSTMVEPAVVQRDSSSSAATAAASPPETVTQAAATPASDSEKDMDLLAGKLYDRIRGRLKTELLIDRERAGLLTDWR